MNHLIVSREYPPPSYTQGGIGTYVAHIARLLAERGETVHVIGERWSGAPLARDVQCDGHLIVHRVAMDAPLPGHDAASERRILLAMLRSDFPAQAFSWQVARLAESLVEEAGIECIEAQEFEAPLYYFLVRRGLGLGPTRRPPCFVHLHSPIQLICHHNDWEIGRPDHLTMKRLEDYVIQASDAALCPSRYLGRQVERHYGLDEGSIERIPYPHGDTPLVERTAVTWQSGTICYFGRMEPRKGVFEWIDAAVRVSRERPGLRFELIGSDTSLSNAWPASVLAALQARVPDDLRNSISFVEALPRQALWHRLALTRIAVVSSRWENYPNTCVEAMSTGLPVLTSPEGGMVEMVEDGRTGWIAEAATTDALATALRRALDTPSETLEQMGRQAAADIRRLCDNSAIVDLQVGFRKRIASIGATRSLTVPCRGSSTILFGAKATEGTPVGVGADTRQGLALVIELGAPDDVDEAIADLVQQTQAPLAVVLDDSGLAPIDRQQAKRRFLEAKLPCAAVQSPDGETGIHYAVGMDASAGAIGIRASGCRLAPEFVEAVTRTFARHPAVGVVSHWHGPRAGDDAGAVRPFPARPYQWVLEDVGPCAAFRTQALAPIDWVLQLKGGHVSTGDLALVILLEGWGALTLPAFLSRRVRPPGIQRRGLERAASVQLRQTLKGRYAARWTADAEEVLTVVRGLTSPLGAEHSAAALLRLPLKDQLRIARRAFREPGKILTWIAARRRHSTSGTGGR